MKSVAKDKSDIVRTKKTPPRVVREYAEVAANVLPTTLRNRCINCAWIFGEVMGRLGFAGVKALSVHVVAMNAAYSSRAAAKTPEERRYWDDFDPWAVLIDGVLPYPSAPGWPGHAVGIVQGWLVDAAVSQMSRPDRGIHLPEVMVLEVTPKFMAGKVSMATRGPDGCVLQYRARPHDTAFKGSLSFSGHSENVAAARELEREIRAKLASPERPTR